MKPSRRRLAAALGAFLAGVGAFVFAGGQVAGCLGPLGVTPIQCAKALGMVPMVGPGLPLAALGVAAGIAFLVPIPAGRRRGSVIAAGVTAGVAAAGFAALWDHSWTGVNSAGRMLSIDRPLDLGALAAAAVVAGLAGALAWAHVVVPIRARFAASR